MLVFWVNKKEKGVSLSCARSKPQGENDSFFLRNLKYTLRKIHWQTHCDDCFTYCGFGGFGWTLAIEQRSLEVWETLRAVEELNDPTQITLLETAEEDYKMKVKVIQPHGGEGAFPTFPKGAKVTLTGGEDTHFLHWFPCEIEGHNTFIPASFFENGVLTRDYNPTELVQSTGDVLEVHEIVNAWLYAANESGQFGWIPAEAVVSVV